MKYNMGINRLKRESSDLGREEGNLSKQVSEELCIKLAQGTGEFCTCGDFPLKAELVMTSFPSTFR